MIKWFKKVLRRLKPVKPEEPIDTTKIKINHGGKVREVRIICRIGMMLNVYFEDRETTDPEGVVRHTAFLIDETRAVDPQKYRQILRKLMGGPQKVTWADERH